MNKKLTIFQDVRELNQWKAIAFGCSLIERMLPNYRLFCSATDFADSSVMENLLQILWNWVLDPKMKINFDVQLENLEEVTPDTHLFDHYGVYPALDCAMSMAAMFNLLKKEDEQGAVVVSKLSQGSVESFIHFTSEEEPDKEEVKAHPLMQWEIATQKELLDLLRTANRSKETVSQLKTLVRQEGISNIGIEFD